MAGTTQNQVTGRLSLAPHLFEAIFQGCSVERVSANQTLFLQDDPSDRLIGIVSGMVEISLYSASGRKIVANIEVAGSLVGEIGALDGQPRTATATTIGECEIVSVSRQTLLERMDREPALASALIMALCARVRWISAEFGDRAMLSIEQRLAKRLLLLQQLLADGDGWIRIAQTDLAEFLGTSRESVNRLLKDWTTGGLIATRRAMIKVVDTQALSAVVEDGSA